MDPMTIALLSSLAPTVLGLFKGAGKDPYQAQLDRLKQLLSPQAVLGDTNQLYQGYTNSPAFAQSQAQGFNTANNLQHNMSLSLANRGLMNTGIGATLGPLSQAAGQFNLGNLRANAYNNASDQAMRLRMALAGGAPQTNPYQMGGNLFGAGMSGLGDILSIYLKSKYPSMTPSMGGSARV